MRILGRHRDLGFPGCEGQVLSRIRRRQVDVSRELILIHEVRDHFQAGSLQEPPCDSGKAEDPVGVSCFRTGVHGSRKPGWLRNGNRETE